MVFQVFSNAYEGEFPADGGEFIEYDAAFLELQQCATGKSEQQFGETIIPAESPDWNQVSKLGMALLRRSLDIRVMTLLARAGTELKGLPALAHHLGRLALALESHWQTVHPHLEVDGEQDPLLRINALAELADLNGLVRSVRNGTLLRDGGAVMTLRDAESLLDGSRTEVAALPGGKQRVVEMLLRLHATGDETLQAVLHSAALLEQIRITTAAHLGEDWVPDFSPLLRPLRLVTDLLESAGAPAKEEGGQAAQEPSGPVPPPAPQNAAAQVQALSWREASARTRGDAALMLEKARQYFENHEPSHPAALLIQRIEQLLPLDFYQLVSNLAPQGARELDVFLPKADASPQET
ncbi:type VI secretion system protein TssA [Paracandidimonas soli]|uniref:Type VI secretion system protein ImpA n=1 Tax=Paracandidimonas soli TaxID=1917182 RepID=A0A4R3USK2_9BURK|nr:type VI secretion system protein TssA [Paracandidimonas soli]TCU93014.1 type VI secretion system protein ImpA [Paracandidimonas soli]